MYNKKYNKYQSQIFEVDINFLTSLQNYIYRNQIYKIK